MQQKKVVFIGGPGTGKSTILNALKEEGFCCYNEVAREVTLEAQKKGIDQLFLEQPLLFSELLLKGREEQYLDASNQSDSIVFFDRGLPDIHAYMDYIEIDYPELFVEKSKHYKYDFIFHFAPWKEIYESDNERYESFGESMKIDTYLLNSYESLGYQIHSIPFGKVYDRVSFIKAFLSLGE